MRSHEDEEKTTDFGDSGEDPQPEVVSTTDPAVESGWIGSDNPPNPDETLVAETSQVTHEVPIRVHLANVKVEDDARNDQDHKEGPSKGDEDHPKKEQHDNQDHPQRNRWVSLALTAAVALVCGVGGAWAFSHFESKDKDSSKNDASKSHSKNDSESDKSSDSDKTSSDKDSSSKSASKSEIEPLMEQIQGLKAQLSTLQERFDAFNGLRNETVRDIGTLQVKVKDLSRSVSDVADVPKRMQPLEGQVDRLQEIVNDLSFQMASREGGRASSAVRPVGDRKRPDVIASTGNEPILASPMIPADPKLPGVTMDAAISLFKKGKYIEAEQIFHDLQGTRGDDARVWYYLALAHGLVTNQWDGETLKYVMDGAEREKKGSPSKAEINAAFANLTPEQGRDWLKAYRERLVKP
jgi:TolA-binding protein